MIHTCGEINCPANPSLTGGIVLVQHESGDTRLMEQGRFSDTLAACRKSLTESMPQLQVNPVRRNIMAMKTIKTTEREVSVDGVKFVAFSDVAGVYPDVLVWERQESGEWTPVVWSSSSSFAGEVSTSDLELEILTRGEGVVLLGSDCTRQEFYEYVFGTDAFKDSAFAESDPEELGFESCVWFPAQFEAPHSLMSNNDYLVEYHEGLDWEEAESEVRKDLDDLNEYTHMEMYGHSYMA